ncbi:MAG: DUF2235 domain-containing protein [Pseudomonadota bacterium]
MTRIAIFCDGTWNSPQLKEVTNVRKLYDALVSDPARGQIAAYFEGIGVVDKPGGWFSKKIDKYGGGAFGWGLNEKVKQAYKFIADAYKVVPEPEKIEIYLFGFSRGAYTARSVAGMIRKCGIIEDTSEAGLDRAFELYRKTGASNAPDQPAIREARRKMSPKFATSATDLEWRGAGSHLVNIAYIGVWDTVGARGVPVALLGPAAVFWNRQYKFHDMELSSLVQSARHALAVDERRLFYVPAKWDNMDRLNGDKDGPFRPYQQVWFIGNHGVVGGSAKAQPLAAIALDWVFRGAGRLTLQQDKEIPLVKADPLAQSSDLTVKTSPLNRWRDGPHREEDMHPSVRTRVSERPDYRPKSLWRLFRG